MVFKKEISKGDRVDLLEHVDLPPPILAVLYPADPYHEPVILNNFHVAPMAGTIYLYQLIISGPESS